MSYLAASGSKSSVMTVHMVLEMRWVFSPKKPRNRIQTDLAIWFKMSYRIRTSNEFGRENEALSKRDSSKHKKEAHLNPFAYL